MLQRNMRPLIALAIPLLAASLPSCTKGNVGPVGSSKGGLMPLADGGSIDAALLDVTSQTALDASQAPPLDGAFPSAGTFCALPGSIISTAQGPITVAGGTTGGLSWLSVPVGFCAHYFATVNDVRQLRFAPDGDLFAASPTGSTTGGAGNGIAGIVVLPDDNRDGVADSNITFLGQLPYTQGLMFAGGYLYYQDSTTLRRVPMRAGDRSPSSSSEVVTTLTTVVAPQAAEHWPKVFDMATDGTIYVSNGGTDGEACTSNQRLFGAIFRLNADDSLSEVARGFRNPMAIRCESDHNVCLAAELAKDYSGAEGGREKLVPIRLGDNWGFPCCATESLPYSGMVYSDTKGVPDCSTVAPESDGFIIGHTPFGIDFETGVWPAPWTHRAFVTLHGFFGSWLGAKVVAAALDPATGLPLRASELDSGTTDPAGPLLDFATGWDDGQRDHGRPAPITFAPDGRLFVGDDQLGVVAWIAPIGLARPAE